MLSILGESVGEKCHFSKILCNSKDVPILKVMQKMVEIYQENDIDMLRLGCTLLNLAIICLHKCTSAKLIPFTESDKDLLEKTCEDMVGGLH